MRIFVIRKNKRMKLIREFTCSMTGTNCVIVLDQTGQELCFDKWEWEDIKKNKKWK
jgi:hypothetical protein|tara:strand:+ start:826 stop:993 length:168 start_codon:yes stop_codon:yes gene_type:complete